MKKTNLNNGAVECLTLMVFVTVMVLLMGLAANGYIERTTGGYISIGLTIIAILVIMFPPQKRNTFNINNK